MGTKLNVALLVYPGVEMVDMNGPADVFLKANNLTNGKYFIYTLAESPESFGSEASVVTITPTYTFDNCPEPDIIIIPGQIISENPYMFGSGSETLIKWLQKMAVKPGIRIMSVCIGAYILANTGLLKNKQATTHYASITDIQSQYPDIRFVKNVRFVPDGNIVTTGGITSGIDGALYLIEKLDGGDIAQHVADIMVYNREAALPPYTLLPPY
ncbi:MAG: DJ-1/PfpI family protein [Bacteroidetes bacterium]|jgi:transcriptional regulator GlxA family with amidase domain|nr:DJ-1/PfpI family protein [Bacteroidota bacterium]